MTKCTHKKNLLTKILENRFMSSVLNFRISMLHAPCLHKERRMDELI